MERNGENELDNIAESDQPSLLCTVDCWGNVDDQDEINT